MSNFILSLSKSKSLNKIAEWYTGQVGYNRLGLYADDLIPDESKVVEEALRRLPRKDFYDRIFRFRRAINASANNDELPEALWTKPEEDKPYLRNIIAQIELEKAIREDYDQMTEIPAHLKNRNKV